MRISLVGALLSIVACCSFAHAADIAAGKEKAEMCVGCHGHEQTVTDRLHTTVASYAYGNSAACYSCHPTGGKTPYDHGGIVGECAMCHDAGNQFAALFIEGLEAIEVQGHVAAFGHVRENVQVITKIIQVMRSGVRFAPSVKLEESE